MLFRSAAYHWLYLLLMLLVIAKETWPFPIADHLPCYHRKPDYVRKRTVTPATASIFLTKSLRRKLKTMTPDDVALTKIHYNHDELNEPRQQENNMSQWHTLVSDLQLLLAKDKDGRWRHMVLSKLPLFMKARQTNCTRSMQAVAFCRNRLSSAFFKWLRELMAHEGHPEFDTKLITM